MFSLTGKCIVLYFVSVCEYGGGGGGGIIAYASHFRVLVASSSIPFPLFGECHLLPIELLFLRVHRVGFDVVVIKDLRVHHDLPCVYG